MSTDIFEKSKVTVRGKLAQGIAQTDKGEFVFYHDDTEKKRVAATLSLQPQQGGEKWAEAEYDVPDVPDDKDNYKLRWELEADSKEVTPGTEDWVIWPLKGKIDAVKFGDTGKKAPGAVLRVMQDSKATPWTKAIDYATKDPGGDLDVNLEKGHPFRVEAVQPWEIKKVEPSPEKGRKRKLEVVRHSVAVFVDPLPGQTPTKQYVNVTTAKDGRDGLGNVVKIKVGIQGDHLVPNGDKIGKAGVFVFVEVTYSGPNGTKSKRDKPKPELKAGLDVSNLVEVTAKVKFTGKVELKGAGGTGEFEIELGMAGGDTCTVKIGCTNLCDQATMEFVNWRKLTYELLFPDFMAQDLEVVNGGGHDIPLAVRTPATGYLTPTFVEYVRLASKSHVPGGALKGKVSAAFLNRNDLRDLYVICDGWKAEIPDNEFTKTADKTCMKMRFCDANYGDAADVLHEPELTAVTTTHDVGLWHLKHNPDTGAPTPIVVTGQKWKVEIDTPDNYKVFTALEWETENAPDATNAVAGTIKLDDVLHTPVSVDIAFKEKTPTLTYTTNGQPDTNGAINGKVILEETNQGRTITIDYAKPAFSHYATIVAPSEVLKIQQFIADILGDSGPILAADYAVSIKIVAEVGNKRRTDRYNNVKQAIDTAFGNAKNAAKWYGMVLEPSEQTKVDNFVKALLVNNVAPLRKQGNRIKLKMTGTVDRTGSQERFDAVKARIVQAYNANRVEIFVHPGLDDNGNVLEGNLDINWLVHETIDKVKITLPTRVSVNDALLPGDIVGVLSPTKAPVTVRFNMVQATGAYNGGAVRDNQTMVLRLNDVTGCAQTVCHELGHSMGMTISDTMTSPKWEKKPPPGTVAKHVDNGGSYYVTAGNALETGGRRKKHTGCHCAAGLELIYNQPAAAWNSTGNCIMWGAGALTRTAFCATCLEYIRARNLKDIQRTWDGKPVLTGRKDEDF